MKDADPMGLQAEIFAKAGESENGYYLLPRKYRNGPDPQWDACQGLVDKGCAAWLPGSSTYWPGIALTGRPLPI